MSDFKEFDQAAPTLTFEPFAEEKESGLSLEKPQQNQPVVEEPVLSPEEQRMVDDFASKIELSNSNLVLQYGAGAQKKIADFSETALGNVRNKDLGEVGELLTDVVNQLKGFDAEEEQKGFLGFFKKSSQNISAMKTKYDKAEVNVNKICKVLEGHQVQLL